MNIWRLVLLWAVRNPIFYLLNSLGCKKYNVGKKIWFNHYCIFMEKMTVRKEKKIANVASTKICVFQYLICIQTYATYANCWTFLTGSTIPWSNWFYNIVKVMSFNKGCELFWLATYQFIHWLELNFQQNDWLAVNFLL